MQYIRRKIEELRRYIARSKARDDLEDVDALLGVALEEVRRKQTVDPERADEPDEPGEPGDTSRHSK